MFEASRMISLMVTGPELGLPPFEMLSESRLTGPRPMLQLIAEKRT